MLLARILDISYHIFFREQTNKTPQFFFKQKSLSVLLVKKVAIEGLFQVQDHYMQDYEYKILHFDNSVNWGEGGCQAIIFLVVYRGGGGGG